MKNETHNDLLRSERGEDKSESHSGQIESRLELAKWLHALEASEHLLQLEAKTSRKIAWCKGVLSRWRAAGYPNPEQWPEIQQHPCLHPSYSLNHGDWPEIENECFSEKRGLRWYINQYFFHPAVGWSLLGILIILIVLKAIYGQ